MKSLGLRRVSIDIALSFGRQFVAGLLQLAIMLFIARLLGPEGTGGYAIALLLPILMSNLLNLGLASANVYFVASDQFRIEQVWASSRNLMLAMSVAGLAIGALLVVFAGETLFQGVGIRTQLIALLVFPPSLLIAILASLYQATQDFRAYNLLVLFQPLIALLLMIVLWAFSLFTLPAVLTVTVLSYAVALVIGLFMLSRRIAIFARPAGLTGYLRPALRYGLQAHMSNLVAFLNYRSDIFLVNLFLGPAATGLYSVAVRLIEQLWMISQAVSTVILPRLASLAGNEEERRALTPVIARMVLWITLFAGGLMAVISRPLITVLFGPEFLGAATALMVLLPGVVLLSCSRVLANDLAARGMVGINLMLAITILVINVAGNLLLIPAYGITGAALATTIAYTSNLLIRLALLNRISGIVWWHVLILMPEDIQRLKSALKRKKSV